MLKAIPASTNLHASVRTMEEIDKDMIYAWRNHPDIRRFMYNQAEITKEEHYRWFISVKSNPLKKGLIFNWGDQPSGFASLSLESHGKTAVWGFYLSPLIDRAHEENKGIGKILGNTVLEYAFEQLQLNKVLGEVIAYNKRSARFHERIGFHKEGELREQYFDGQNYFSIICYGITRQDWLQARYVDDD